MQTGAQVKKKDLVEDLRNTHFELGHDGRGDFKSIYKKDYPEWPMENKDQAINSNLLRKTHFVAGTEDQNNRFTSMYKEDFLQHPPNQSPQLSEETQKDLRKHHFTYGFDKRTPEDNTSENHREYVKKTVPQGDLESQKKMREIVSSSVS
jgi:hypothetical protein